MKLVPLSYIFEAKYGVNLELNRLELDFKGINFVSRTAENNGISARVKLIPTIKSIDAGVITVSGGGSVMEAFVQPEPFYCGRDIYFLRPLKAMTLQEKLYYCFCIRANKHKYSYGRQANRTLKDLMIPSSESIPSWVATTILPDYSKLDRPKKTSGPAASAVRSWKKLKLSELFDLKKGKRLTEKDRILGTTPYVGATDSNNGITDFIGQLPLHQGNTITVSYNGSIGEAFYQTKPFWATDDVNVLYPKFDLNIYRAMFLITLIRLEKHKFNYGRKWNLERMKDSTLRLPLKDGSPDWEFMDNYIKALPYSSNL